MGSEVMGIPTLRTERLVLRAFSMGDAEAVTALAGAREVAATTLLIPHPYQKSDAEGWIAAHGAEFASGVGADFAITLREGATALREGTVVGAIGLRLSKEHNRADFGYWIGVPYWGCGYATEAGREILRYGFVDLGMQRMTAHHFATNPASGRVIEKLGLKKEGVFPRHVRKWGEYLDCVMFGVVREDWERAR
jgi:[ribosomal protein S5]-alanine N-acetyltransferase